SCFFHDPPPTEIYTLSLHDALPIYLGGRLWRKSTAREISSREADAAFDLVRRSGIDPAPDRATVTSRDGGRAAPRAPGLRLRRRSEEHTSELQSRSDLVCRLLLEKK